MLEKSLKTFNEKSLTGPLAAALATEQDMVVKALKAAVEAARGEVAKSEAAQKSGAAVKVPPPPPDAGAGKEPAAGKEPEEGGSSGGGNSRSKREQTAGKMAGGATGAASSAGASSSAASTSGTAAHAAKAAMAAAQAAEEEAARLTAKLMQLKTEPTGKGDASRDRRFDDDDDERGGEDVCIDLVVEPSLEGGRLLALERARSPARAKVIARLRAQGWNFRWVRPSHYSSVHVQQWLTQKFWHPSRLHTMSPGGEGSPISAQQRRAVLQQQGSDPGATLGLGLRGWRKFLFRGEEVEALRQACESAGLKLENLHLLTAVRQQTIPLSALRLWTAHARLFLERHTHALLAVVIALILAGAQVRRVLRERARRLSVEKDKQERAARKLAEAQEKKERRGEQLKAEAAAKAKREREEAAKRDAAREKTRREAEEAKSKREAKKVLDKAKREARNSSDGALLALVREGSCGSDTGTNSEPPTPHEAREATTPHAPAPPLAREGSWPEEAGTQNVAEEQARREAAEWARRESVEAEQKRLADDRRQAQAEAEAARKAEEKAKKEAEERAKREAEEKAKKEAERLRKLAEETAREEAAKKEAERAKEAEARAARQEAVKVRREAQKTQQRDVDSARVAEARVVPESQKPREPAGATQTTKRGAAPAPAFTAPAALAPAALAAAAPPAEHLASPTASPPAPLGSFRNGPPTVSPLGQLCGVGGDRLSISTEAEGKHAIERSPRPSNGGQPPSLAPQPLQPQQQQLSASDPPLWKGKADAIESDDLGILDLDASVAERAALSVLDDFDFDTPPALGELEESRGGARLPLHRRTTAAGAIGADAGPSPLAPEPLAAFRAAPGSPLKLSSSISRGAAAPSPSGVPHELLCPISHELMVDPVLAADGHAYERGDALHLSRLQRMPRTCPSADLASPPCSTPLAPPPLGSAPCVLGPNPLPSLASSPRLPSAPTPPPSHPL